MAFSRQFVWVTVNRDETPDVPKKYGVTSYPTLLFLNEKDEKIHRFKGFKESGKLLAEFFEAAGRWAQYRAGEKWDTPLPRPKEIITGRTAVKIAAPFEGVPSGLVAYGGDIFVAERERIHRIDAETGKVKAAIAGPLSVVDLTTDGELLYALEYGWTAGKPIHVVDPVTGKVVRKIVTEANAEKKAFGAKGIAWRDGKLWVLEGMKGLIHEVDPKTGDVLSTLTCGAKWVAGLAWDGKRFVTGGRESLFLIDGTSGKVSLEVPVNYRLRSVAVLKGEVLLMEQPIFGHDRKHKRVQVWPEKTWIYRVKIDTPR